jgi:mRNA interferase RelE/StbE
VAWRVTFDARAYKELEAIGKPDAERVLKALRRLAIDPLKAANVKALRGEEGYRLRVGDYRVLYKLKAGELLVLVVKVGHRREVYR